DLAVRAQMPSARVLPEHTAVIIDEAHMLEEIAAEYFGRAVSSMRVKEMVRDVNEFATLVLMRSLRDLAQNLDAAGHEMWASLPHDDSGQVRATLESFDLTRFEEAAAAVLTKLGEVDETLRLLAEKGVAEAQGLRRRAALLFADLEFIAGQKDEYFVYW